MNAADREQSKQLLGNQTVDNLQIGSNNGKMTSIAFKKVVFEIIN